MSFTLRLAHKMMGGGSNGGEGGSAPWILPVLRPHNSYDIYSILERVRLIETKRREGEVGGGAIAGGDPRPSGGVAFFTGYERLEMSALPPRYEHLGRILSADWHVPGKQRGVKRKHSRTRGLPSSKEIAVITAENWKAVDPVTKAYAEAVAHIQKERYHELKMNGHKRPDNAGRDGASKNEAAPRRMMPDPDRGPLEGEHSLGPGGSERSFPRSLTPTGPTDGERSLGLLTESEHSSQHSLSEGPEGCPRCGSPSLHCDFCGIALGVPREQDFFFGNNNNNVGRGNGFDEAGVNDEDIMEAYHTAR